MNTPFTKVALLFLGICLNFVLRAQESPNTIDYQVTYDSGTQTYSVWVVPNYSVPNAYNSENVEKGATAQVSLVVPRSFTITSITDVRGTWDKQLFKLGPGQSTQDWSGYNLDPNLNYYVIGKSAVETDYGTFTSGTPVLLFTFKGSGCFGAVSILKNGDPFINAAFQKYSLNVPCSFYSRSANPAGGNQNPLEQFRSQAGNDAACNTSQIVANNDNTTTSFNQPKVISVLANDSKNGSIPTAADVTISVTSPPTNGSYVINADGTITYTPNNGFSGTDCFTYKICDKAAPAVCDDAQVCVTVTPNTTTTELGITKSVDKSTASLNDIVTFTIQVKNNSTITATNVVVKDMLPAGLSYVSGAQSIVNGEYLWTFATIAPNETKSVTLTAKVIAAGVTTNYAKINSLDQTDSNLANNEASICVSVPVVLCQGESLQLTAPSNFQNVTWYKDGVAFGNGNTVTVTQSGSYLPKDSSGSCPASGCCPVVVTTQVCCTTNICIPLTITKIR